MRENRPVGGNPGRRESDKQDISRRVSSAYMPSESHKRKVENFRLNITDELPIGGENPRSAQPAGGGKPPQEPRPSTAKIDQSSKESLQKKEPAKKPEKPLALSKHLVGYGGAGFCGNRSICHFRRDGYAGD